MVQDLKMEIEVIKLLQMETILDMQNQEKRRGTEDVSTTDGRKKFQA